MYNYITVKNSMINDIGNVFLSILSKTYNTILINTNLNGPFNTAHFVTINGNNFGMNLSRICAKQVLYG